MQGGRPGTVFESADGKQLCGKRRMAKDVHDACDSSYPGHAMVVSDGPAHISKHSKEHAEHKDEPIFRLVDAVVPLRHPDDAPVVERPGHEHREDDPDDAAQVR